VGGAFFRAGQLHASNVARLGLETQAWSAVGSVPTCDGDVMALAAIHDRYLIIGGRFGELWSGTLKASGQNNLVLFDTHAPPDPADPSRATAGCPA
jgi:hypothetical protein